MQIMETKIIRTDEQHRAYLREVGQLISATPQPGSTESERLEVLSVLIESYENNKMPVEAPDPIDAILFRMQERNLKQADLVPYFGTRSRVSEVLSRKRALTVQMIRAVSIGLGISTETLVGSDSGEPISRGGELDWTKFPYKEMERRGWMDRFISKTLSIDPNHAVQRFIEEAGVVAGASAFRRTISGSASSPTTRYALLAWLSRVVQVARSKRAKVKDFDHGTLSAGFLRELAQLSWYETGPLLAVEYLEKHGICVVIEQHLKGTHLDGAALRDSDGLPIVALTLRHDRLDNFWFTLLHEVAHIWKHVGDDHAILDDLDSTTEDRQETEANRIAREAFIPRLVWKRSDAYQSPSIDTIDALARELKIHPAVVAGRIRREKGDYRLFNDLVVGSKIRQMFEFA